MKILLLSLFLSIIQNKDDKLGLIVNEILFNPYAGGVDFVELYNNSPVAVDLQQIYLANVNNAGEIANIQRVSASSHLMSPGTYRVLTTDPTAVAAHYPKARLPNFIRMSRLPNFNNDRGQVVLLYATGITAVETSMQVLDSLNYAAGMHSPYIKNPKGISLERQAFATGTNTPGNFRSASVSAGGATPGYKNSNTFEEQTSIQLKSGIVSPDQDGHEDELELLYNIPRTGLMATIEIYNSQGRRIRYLLRNTSIPSQGNWIWDGRDEQGQIPKAGIYTIVIELYNASGYHRIFRKSFVVAVRI